MHGQYYKIMGLLQVFWAQGYHDIDDEKPSTGAAGPKESICLGKKRSAKINSLT